MARPRYPTREGLWSRGKRPERAYREVRLGSPYPEAIRSFREATEGRDDFDPATLLAWGTIQSTAVLNILEDAEQAFGEAGQEMVRKAIQRAGREAMESFLDDSSFPEDIDEVEKASYLATGINTVLYASLERPRIVSEDRCEFDILWCPHQDRYRPFDCRVQRYFVEGISQAMAERGPWGFAARVEKLIPRGDDRCHFVLERSREAGGEDPWSTRSDELGRRALEEKRGKTRA